MQEKERNLCTYGKYAEERFHQRKEMVFEKVEGDLIK